MPSGLIYDSNLGCLRRRPVRTNRATGWLPANWAAEAPRFRRLGSAAERVVSTIDGGFLATNEDRGSDLRR